MNKPTDQAGISYNPVKFRFSSFSNEVLDISNAAAARKNKEANWFIKKDPLFIHFVAVCQQAKVTPTLRRLLVYMEKMEASDLGRVTENEVS